MNKISETRIARKYLSLRDSAQKRGHDFNLSLTSVRNLLNSKKCAFTGQPLNSKTLTVDRIDASKGYVKGNVVACHKLFNIKKGALTKDEIVSIYDVMKKRKIV